MSVLNDSYEEYRRSEEWQKIRMERMKIDGHRCVMCQTSGTSINPLEVHHFGYRNVFHEDVYTELVTVCASCHLLLHRVMKRIVDADGRRGFTSVEVPEFSVIDVHGDVTHVKR